MDFRRTREAAFQQRQQKVLAMRCEQLLSKEEGAYRRDILSDHKMLFNRMAKDFTKGLMVLAYYNQSSTGAAASAAGDNHGAMSGPLRKKGARKKAGAFPQGGDLASRISKAGAMYNNGPPRVTKIEALHRSHYRHHLPPTTNVEVLPPVPPYELRLLAVREAGAREEVVHAEIDFRDRLHRHMMDVTQETRNKEDKLQRVHGHLGGSSPSRLAPIVREPPSSTPKKITSRPMEKKKPNKASKVEGKDDSAAALKKTESKEEAKRSRIECQESTAFDDMMNQYRKETVVRSLGYPANENRMVDRFLVNLRYSMFEKSLERKEEERGNSD